MTTKRTTFSDEELWHMARLQNRAGSDPEARRELIALRRTMGMTKIREMQRRLGELRNHKRKAGRAARP